MQLWDLSAGLGTACAEFIEALEAAPPGSRGVVFDVGANDGAWSASWGPHIERFRAAHKTIDLIFFEPQAVFASRLASLAKRLNATFMPAAAWNSDTALEISSRVEGSVSATVRPVATTHRGDEAGSMGASPSLTAKSSVKSTVRAVDLAAYVMRTLPRTGDAQELSLMKLDVEGAGARACG
jgi:FkbM family methyltransferase